MLRMRHCYQWVYAAVCVILQSTDIATSVRSFVNLGEGEEPVLALFDIPEERKFTMPAKDITKDAIRRVVEDFKAGKTQFKPFSE